MSKQGGTLTKRGGTLSKQGGTLTKQGGTLAERGGTLILRTLYTMLCQRRRVLTKLFSINATLKSEPACGINVKSPERAVVAFMQVVHKPCWVRRAALLHLTAFLHRSTACNRLSAYIIRARQSRNVWALCGALCSAARRAPPAAQVWAGSAGRAGLWLFQNGKSSGSVSIMTTPMIIWSGRPTFR